MADDGKEGDEGEPTKDKDGFTYTTDEAGNKVFQMSQEDLNKMQASNRRKLTKDNTTMAEQLEQLQGKVALSDQQREEMESTIETLRTQSLTTDELAKRDAKKLAGTHQKTVDSLTVERDDWKTLFTGAEIRRGIVDAAVAAQVYDPEQIVEILEKNTHLVEETDEATKKTSRKIVVDFESQDDDGNNVVLNLSPDDALKAMREVKRFANQFVQEGQPGLGQQGNADEADGAPNMDSMESYMKWREKNRATLGT